MIHIYFMSTMTDEWFILVMIMDVHTAHEPSILQVYGLAPIRYLSHHHPHPIPSHPIPSHPIPSHPTPPAI